MGKIKLDGTRIQSPDPSGCRSDARLGAGRNKADFQIPLPSAIEVEDDQTTFAPAPPSGPPTRTR